MHMLTNLSVLLSALRKLESQNCWSLTCGGAAGNILGIELGTRIHRTRKLNNPHISEDLKIYRGTFGLLVYCEWAILSDNECKGSSLNDLSLGSATQVALTEMANRSVVSATFVQENCDLLLKLDNHYDLILNCGKCESEDSYTLFCPTGCFIVKKEGWVQYEAMTALPN